MAKEQEREEQNHRDWGGEGRGCMGVQGVGESEIPGNVNGDALEAESGWVLRRHHWQGKSEGSV